MHSRLVERGGAIGLGFITPPVARRIVVPGLRLGGHPAEGRGVHVQVPPRRLHRLAQPIVAIRPILPGRQGSLPPRPPRGAVKTVFQAIEDRAHGWEENIYSLFRRLPANVCPAVGQSGRRRCRDWSAASVGPRELAFAMFAGQYWVGSVHYFLRASVAIISRT